MKLKKLFAVTAAAAALAAGICATSAFADFPTQWTYTYSEGAEESNTSGVYVLNKTGATPLSGSYYLHAWIPRNETGTGTVFLGNRYARSEPMQLEDGKEYKLSFWISGSADCNWWQNNVRVADINNPNISAKTEGNEDNFYGMIGKANKSQWIDGKEWHKCEGTFTYDASKTTEPCVYFLFRYSAYQGVPTEFFIDNCTVVATDDPTETNLLPNGDFDAPADNQITPWIAISKDGNMSTKLSVDRAAGQNIANVQDGNYTLRIVHMPESSDYIGAYSNPISLKKGKKYTLTFSLDGNADQRMFNIRFAKAETPWSGIKIAGGTRADWNGYGGWGIAEGAGDTRWMKLELTADNDYDDIRLVLSLPQNGWGTSVYVDSVCLTEEGSDANMIKDGSFEENMKPEEVNTVADETFPERFTATVGGNGSADFLGKVLSVVSSYAYDGKYSLKVKSFGVPNNEQYGLYQRLPEGLATGTYTVSFKARGDIRGKLGFIPYVYGTNGQILSQDDFYWLTGSEPKINGKPLSVKYAGQGWYEYSWQVDATGAAPREFKFNFYANLTDSVFYIDDIKIVNDEKPRVNLVTNGSFETRPAAPGAVTALNAENREEAAYLSWSNPENAYCVNIYDVTDGACTLLKTVIAPENSALIDGLENGKKYTLSVKAANRYGIESDGASTEATPILPDVSIGSIISSNGSGTFIDGENTFSVTVKNNKLESFPVTLVAALYDNSGKLTAADVSRSAVLAEGDRETLTATLNVPENMSGYTVKAFVIDSLSGMKPYGRMGIFTPDSNYTPKTVIDTETLLSFMSGASNVTADTDGYIDAQRFTEEQKTYFKSLGFGSPLEERMASFSFETDSEKIFVDYKKGRYANGDLILYVDGKYNSSISNSRLDDAGVYCFDLDGSKHKIDLYLPQNGFYLRNISVVKNSEVSAVEGRKKALFYGDSITNGMGIYALPDYYASIVSRELNYSYLNLGISGYTFDPKQIMEIPGYEPDVIFVAYGINDAGMSDFAANYRTRVTNFFDNLTALYPGKRIYAITPIWTNLADRQENLEASRTVLKEVCRNYENIRTIDGENMVPADASYFTDGIHPNTKGAAIYAENLIADVQELDKQ